MRGPRRRQLQAVLFLIVLAAIPYVPFLDGYFLSDDLMLDYFLLEDGELSWSRMAYHFFPTEGYVAREIYRPFDFVLLAFDWTFWRTDPTGYHLTNLAFHIWCTLLVYFLIRRLGPSGQRFPAVFGGALFAWHPLAPEAVQWIVGRVDLTQCFFTLLAMLFFLVYRQRGGAGRLVGMSVALVFGLLSKETAIFVPGYLLVADLCATRRCGARIVPHVLTFGIVAAYFGLRYACFGRFLGKYESAGAEMASSLAANWPRGMAQVGHVVQEIFVPLRETAFELNEAAALWFCLLFGYGAIVAVAVSRGLLRAAAPSRAAIFAGLWLLATLVPLMKLLLLLPITGDHLNGRLAYLPLAAFCTAFPLFLFGADSWKERTWTRLRFASAGLLLVVFLPITITHTQQFVRGGEAICTLRDRVTDLYAVQPPGTPVIIENPPREMTGVYVLRTGLQYLFKPPFSAREIPVIGLNLTTPDEFGAFLVRYPESPLIVHWRDDLMRVQDHTRGYSGDLPAWRGEALRTLRTGGAVADLADDVLHLERDDSPGCIVVESPPIHVPTGVAQAVSAEFSVEAGAVGMASFVLTGLDAKGERRAIVIPAGPALGPDRLAHVRIGGVRNRLSVYAQGRGADATPIKRLERLGLRCPTEWRNVRVRSLALHRVLPKIGLVGPPDRAVFPTDGDAAPFTFRALDGCRYYRLVIDSDLIGRQVARFDAWASNAGRPVAGGELVTKSIAGGNLDASDFSLDPRTLGAEFRGKDLPFAWSIEAISHPSRPWDILARSAWRTGLIR